ncbi:MAG: AAA family ATPase [Erythrobacter sp.]
MDYPIFTTIYPFFQMLLAAGRSFRQVGAMLAERDIELSRLSALLEGTSAGGRVVTVSGEAGIGKTALLREFAARHAQDCRFIWGMCDALFTPRPLGPVHDIAAMMADLEDNWQNSGGTALFSQILAKLSHSEHPVVLVIEDVHWADVGTLDFIRFLGRRITMCSALMIISFRNDELRRDHPLLRVLGDIPSDQLERIELQSLSLAAVARMTDDSGRDPEKLLAVTNGNPFFLSEILASKDAHRQVPASVQDAVNGRLARLSCEHIRLLEALSIIPVHIVPELHCGWIDNYQELLRDCLDLSILVEDADGRLRFRHELARLATCNRCSSIELRNLHRKHLAFILENSEIHDAGELLHHARGAVDAEKVLQFAPIAAEKAALLGAHKEAADYLEAALEYVDEAKPEEAARLYESWAYEAAIAHRIDDRVIEARRHALTMWRALGNDERIADNLRHLSRLHWYRGEAIQASRYLDDAVQLLERLDNKSMLALAYSMRSQMHMLASRMEEAISWGQRALTVIENEDNPEVEVHALNNIGTARLFLGEEQGIADLKNSLDLALTHNLHEDAARVFTNLSEYAIDMRRLDIAESTLERGIKFDTEHELDSWTFYLLGRKAQLRLEQGRLDEVEEICRSVIGTPGQTLLMKLPARIMLARFYVRSAHEDAASTLQKAYKDALATGEVQYCIPVLIAMLEQAWLTDSEDLADQAASGLDRIERSCFSLWSRAENNFWRALAGMPSECTDDKEKTAFGPAIEGDYTEAGMRFARLGADYLANLCFGLSNSAETVSAGLAALNRQGAKGAIVRITESFESRGIAREDVTLPRGPYRASRENAFGLTAKEMTVLEHLAKGFSNAQIAEEMSRSQRTIEHHVSAILQKLEVENRLGVLLKLRDEPWIIGET